MRSMQFYSLYVRDPAEPEKGWQPAEGVVDTYLNRWFWRPMVEPYMSDVLDEVTAVAEAIVEDNKVSVRVVDSGGAVMFESPPEAN